MPIRPCYGSLPVSSGGNPETTDCQWTSYKSKSFAILGYTFLRSFCLEPKSPFYIRHSVLFVRCFFCCNFPNCRKNTVYNRREAYTWIKFALWHCGGAVLLQHLHFWSPISPPVWHAPSLHISRRCLSSSKSKKASLSYYARLNCKNRPHLWHVGDFCLNFSLILFFAFAYRQGEWYLK